MPLGRPFVTFRTTWRATGGIVLLAALCCGATLLVPKAGGETVRQGSLQVSFGGSVSPHLLPRFGATPIAVTIRGHVRALTAAPPPSLRRIAIEVNRLGVLERAGLPACPLARLRAASTEAALEQCRAAKVGEGRVGGVLVLPEQTPTPFGGRVVAFNGTLPDGRPGILAHLYTSRPAPLTFVLSFAIGRAHGTFGTRLVATVPLKTRRTAHITSFTLRLHRTYEVDGSPRSYLSAGCPAPEGFPSVTFPLVRTSYGFEGEKTVSDTLVRTCQVAAATENPNNR
jgi:hypothetical protein